MRRRMFVAAALIGTGAVAGWFATHRPINAQVARPVAAETAAATKLPIRKVALFSSGVGYFQREGEVTGDAKIDLIFPDEDINDLLKSLTVQDLGGGRVQAVGYDSHDPVERTLKSFAIDLSENPTQARILAQARGERVEVTLTNGSSLTGSIVGVENAPGPIFAGVFESLNLLTTEGLRSAKLAEVQKVRFLNAALESELRRALETLALSRDTQKKAVKFRFTGAGKRAVRVSYVVENPIWKTSYRLTLDKDGKPFLQGWAVIENPTDEDWTDVRMALVSGRPISFKMDLYSPLYVPRPTVEPELFASLRPPSYDGAMERGGNGFAGGGGGQARPNGNLNLGFGGGQLGFAGGTQTVNTDQFSAPRAPDTRESRARNPERRNASMVLAQSSLVREDDDRPDLTRGVTSAAQGTKLGDYFQYTLEDPITVARQKAAMLPIVNRAVDGSRVSIYNSDTHPKYPLLGLRFKNNSGLNLMQGPITVFDGQGYAGDARLPDLQPDEDRLLSYAIDLGTKVEAKSKVAPAVFTTIKVVKGVLSAKRKIHEEKTYSAVNRSKTDRTLLIEHPYRPDFALAGPTKPAERSRDLYRFELKLAAGGKGEVDVVEEKEIDQSIALLNANDQEVLFYLRLPAINPKVRAALDEAIGLKSKWTAAGRDHVAATKQLADITHEQERLRANLKELPPTAAAYKRYLEKFDTQETQIEKLQVEQKRLQEAESMANAKYEQYVTTLSVE